VHHACFDIEGYVNMHSPFIAAVSVTSAVFDVVDSAVGCLHRVNVDSLISHRYKML
jgi:hypothetical protein